MMGVKVVKEPQRRSSDASPASCAGRGEADARASAKPELQLTAQLIKEMVAEQVAAQKSQAQPAPQSAPEPQQYAEPQPTEQQQPAPERHTVYEQAPTEQLAIFRHPVVVDQPGVPPGQQIYYPIPQNPKTFPVIVNGRFDLMLGDQISVYIFGKDENGNASLLCPMHGARSGTISCALTPNREYVLNSARRAFQANDPIPASRAFADVQHLNQQYGHLIVGCRPLHYPCI
ncbi:MAG: hypothetical protein J2P21_30335 [Chloracidobacterium sp.]|nr:hypothetical protein [Chloracidobacterium sp.]